jgi:hypothetical protein
MVHGSTGQAGEITARPRMPESEDPEELPPHAERSVMAARMQTSFMPVRLDAAPDGSYRPPKWCAPGIAATTSASLAACRASGPRVVNSSTTMFLFRS